MAVATAVAVVAETGARVVDKVATAAANKEATAVSLSTSEVA